jgi:xylulokinase
VEVEKGGTGVTDGSLVLAIDLGTSAVKTALVSQDGHAQAVETRPIFTRLLPGGGAEQDPEQWWQASCEAARRTLAAVPNSRARTAGVVCTTQWAVTVPVDRTGKHLGPAISWMDSRGAPYVRRMVGGWPQIFGYQAYKLWTWVRLTGGCPSRAGVDGLAHILFLQNERPEIYRAADKFVEPMDYLNARLTGRVAASFGTMFPYWLTDNRDPCRIAYHPRLIAWAGIDPAKLPPLLPVGAQVGGVLPEVAEELGLAPGTPVLAGSCDGQAAAIGAGSVRDFAGYFYVGSTAWMSCHVPRKKTDLLHMITTMPAALPGRYVVMAEQGIAGRFLEVVKDNLLLPPGDPTVAELEDPYAYLNRLAASVPPGCDGVLFTPWVNGILVPADDPHTRSTLANFSHRTGRAHVVRAVFEGVAYNIRWLREHVEKFVGQRFPSLRFIGGGAVSDLWCQIFADVLGVPIERVAQPRAANAVGAALAAFVALGRASLAEIERAVRVERTFLPEETARRHYDQAYAEFRHLYRVLKPTYRRWNRGGHKRRAQGEGSREALPASE